MKFRGLAGSLNLAFNSGAGNASWTTTSPFEYDLRCPGDDHQGQGDFSYQLNFDMQKKPVPYGASTLNGSFEFYEQKNTISYFQTAPKVTGSLTMKGFTSVPNRRSVQSTSLELDRLPCQGSWTGPPVSPSVMDWTAWVIRSMLSPDN